MTDLERDILIRLSNNENVTSSDRPGDRARTRLKKLGYIVFDRSKWRWYITHAGQDALAESPDGKAQQ